MVEQLILKNLPDSEVRVTDLTGTKDHIGLLIVSDAFKGKTLLEQHQMIMDILRQSLKEQVHAVQIKTMTKEAYSRQTSSST